MKDQKKNYQEPALNVIKMRSMPCLDSGSVPAGGDDYHPARQNDMLDD
jgi:hypothetical protein